MVETASAVRTTAHLCSSQACIKGLSDLDKKATSLSHFCPSLQTPDMFTNNPYAQAGWHNPQNPHSINQSPWRPNSSHPPTFGALPNLNENPASVLTFEFSSFNPDILNCLVTGPKGRKFFDIRTSNSTTIISKPGEAFATIYWARHPMVEAPGVISRQATGDFIKLSQDQA